MNKTAEKGYMRGGPATEEECKRITRVFQDENQKARAQPDGLMKIKKGFYRYVSRKWNFKKGADPLMKQGKQPSD